MKIECVMCGEEKSSKSFEGGSDICRSCERRMHEEAERFAAKREQREAGARQEEKKTLSAEQNANRDAERQKAPPREYPWPWRRSK